MMRLISIGNELHVVGLLHLHVVLGVVDVLLLDSGLIQRGVTAHALVHPLAIIERDEFRHHPVSICPYLVWRQRLWGLLLPNLCVRLVSMVEVVRNFICDSCHGELLLLLIDFFWHLGGSVMGTLDISQILLPVRRLEAILNNLGLILNVHSMVADNLTVAKPRIHLAAERYLRLLVSQLIRYGIIVFQLLVPHALRISLLLLFFGLV